MAWQDRLREAAYTSPGGTRLTFLYEAVVEEFDQKGGPFDFAGADGTYMQPLGVTGRRYPIKLIVSGADYDLDANAWMDALSERGPGVLEHPVYGRKDVVPYGKVKRADNPAGGAGQAIIEVTFFETTGVVYPVTASDPAQQVNEAAGVADAAQAAQLADSGVLDTATDRADFLSRFDDAISTVQEAMAPVVETIDTVQRTFSRVQRSINNAIDVLVRQPLAMASQVQQLIKTPGRILGQITGRLEAYGNLGRQLLGINDRDGNSRPRAPTPGALPVPPVQVATTRPQLFANDMFASATMVASAVAAVNTTYPSRQAAIAAAEEILTQLEELAEWRDQSFRANDETDPGGAWQATQAVAQLAAGAIIQVSFGLATERRIVLTSDRSLVDLTFELYGEVDTRLDDMINNNNLSGDEIIELPRGREIIYYE